MVQIDVNSNTTILAAPSINLTPQLIIKWYVINNYNPFAIFSSTAI